MFEIRTVLHSFCQLDIIGIVVRFLPSLKSSITTMKRSAFERLLFPVHTLTNSSLERCEVSMFWCTDVTGFWSVLNLPTMGGRDFVFPQKNWDKNVSGRIFSTTTKENPVSFFTHWRNIHSDRIICTMAA